MAELKGFRAFLDRQSEAEEALLHGDVEPRLRLWSRRDPVSLLGAWGPNKTGWDELERIFRWVAERLGSTPKTDWRFKVSVAEVSADGQMAYSVGFKRFTETLAGGGSKQWTVRVTHAIVVRTGTGRSSTAMATWHPRTTAPRRPRGHRKRGFAGDQLYMPGRLN